MAVNNLSPVFLSVFLHLLKSVVLSHLTDRGKIAALLTDHSVLNRKQLLIQSREAVYFYNLAPTLTQGTPI